MSERVDRTLDARFARNKATNAANLVQSHDDQGALAIAAIAQVHATLALVEQQRVANIIALANFRIGVADLSEFRSLLVQPKDESAIEIKPEIRKVLGL